MSRLTVVQDRPQIDDNEAIAVHGLCGDGKNTWESSSRRSWGYVDWLEVFCQRVSVYEYTSLDQHSNVSIRQGIRKEALRLLEAILQKPREDDCKIVFVGHDIGGIVIKEALLLAAFGDPRFRPIYRCTRVMIFIGCPHSLESSPGLDDSLLRLCKSSQNESLQSITQAKGLSRSIQGINQDFVQTGLMLSATIYNVFSVGEEAIARVFDLEDTSMVFPFSMNRYQEGVKVSHSDLTRQVSDELKDRMWTILDFDDDDELLPQISNLIRKATPKPFPMTSSINNVMTERDLRLLDNGDFQTWISTERTSFLAVKSLSAPLQTGIAIWNHLTNPPTARDETRGFVQYFEFSKWDYRFQSVGSMMSNLLAEICYDVSKQIKEYGDRDNIEESQEVWHLEDQFLLLQQMILSPRCPSIVWVLVNLGNYVSHHQWLLDKFQSLSTMQDTRFKAVFLNGDINLASFNPEHSHFIDINLVQDPAIHPENPEASPSEVLDAQHQTTPLNKQALEVVMEHPQLFSLLSHINGLFNDSSVDPELRQMLVSQLPAVSKNPDRLDRTLADILPLSTKTIFPRVLKSAIDNSPELTLRVLKLISLSFRPFTIHELTDLAESFNKGKVSQSPGYIDLDKIMSQLPGLLMFQRNEVHFCHQDLRAFILSDQEIGFHFKDMQQSISHGKIAYLCLEYMISPHGRRILEQTNNSFASDAPRPDSHLDFCSYAVRHWPRHAEVAGEQFDVDGALLRAFLSDSALLHMWAHCYWKQSNTYDKIQFKPQGPLAIFAEHGLKRVLDFVLSNREYQQWVEASSDALVTFAHNETLHCIESVAESLSLSVETTEKAMLASVHTGKEKDFMYLWKKRLEMPPDFVDVSAILYRAAWLRRDGFVRHILESTTGTFDKTFNKTILLEYCGKGGSQQTAIGILEGLGERFYYNDLLPAMFQAVRYGHSDLLVFLMERYLSFIRQQRKGDGGNIGHENSDEQDDMIEKLFERAIHTGQQKPLISLLRVMQQHNIEYSKAGPSICLAIEENRTGCFKTLLNAFVGLEPHTFQKSSVDLRDIMKIAMQNGNASILWELLQRGLALDGDEYESTIFRSVEEDLPDLMQILVDKGHPALDHDLYVNTIASGLAEAVHDNKPAMAKILVKAKPDLNRRGIGPLPSGRTPLYHASYRGYAEIVTILIEAGADCRAKDEEGSPPMEPIHAGSDNVDVLQALLTKETNIDINAPTADGITPLILATRNGYEACINVMLQHGADVCCKTKYGDTAITIAIANGYQNIATKLLERALEYLPPVMVIDSQLLLHKCIRANNIELLKQLLQYNISLDAVDDDGRTALNCIDFGTDTEVLRLLVHRGMCVNTKDNDGLTPLAKAVGFDNLPNAEFLVSYGANTNDWIGAPGTLIHLACAECSLDMIRLLVDNNANLNVADESMNGTVFQSACQRCESNGSKSEVLNYLLSTGRINIQQSSSWWGSNINTACLMADYEIVQRLVDDGANVEASDKIGRRPIHFALYQSLDFVQCLQDKGASLEAIDKIGRNALHFAVLSGSLDVVQHVLSHKRDMINMPDRDGWTPLFWALRNSAHWTTGPCQQGEIVCHLITEGARILIRDNDKKWSPLQVAQYHGYKEDILSQVRPTEEQITAIEDGEEKKWWKLTVARPPKPAGKYDRAYCDVCLVDSMGTYYICDECESFLLCFKCFQSKDMVHPQTFSKHTDDADRQINIDEEAEDSADVKSQSSVESASVASQSDNDMEDAESDRRSDRSD